MEPTVCLEPPCTSYREFFSLYDALLARRGTAADYWVPSVLVGGGDPSRLVNVGDPYRFFAQTMKRIAATPAPAPRAAGFSMNDCIYQSYIRTFASLNWEIGTALKQIAFLPFLAERLGVTIYISLPSGVIGKTNRKGTRGSPFAIKDPFAIDNSLADPLLPGVPALDQYKALTQSCAMLGIRAGSIVPLATLSIDCPLFRAWPALGFWWTEAPGKLLFASRGADPGGPEDSVPRRRPVDIGTECRAKFVEPPLAEEVYPICLDGQTFYVADVVRSGSRRRITLANAFPDPVAGEHSQYTWKDVSAIRYTADLYPPAQGVTGTRDLDPGLPAARIMPEVIAWRARQLGETCFVIDVNESVPAEILARARCGAGLQQPPLEFIAEELWRFDAASRETTAVIGPLVYCVSAHSHNEPLLISSLRYHLELLQSTASPNYYFGGVANHDTMPPSRPVTPLLYAMYSLLPRSLPMIFSGNEFYAQSITNREFGFSSDELRSLRAQLNDDALGLFNDLPLVWSTLPAGDSELPLIELLAALRGLRRAVFAWRSDETLDYRFLETPDEPHCFGYRRAIPESRGHDAITVYSNWSRDTVCLRELDSTAALVGSVGGCRRPAFGAGLVLEPYSAAIVASGLFRGLRRFVF